MQENRDNRDIELVKRAQAGEAQATEMLLNEYKGAVLARARQFFLAGGETDDLVQEGMIGLYFAIRNYRFDCEKSFKNFAYLCVSRRIYDAIGKMSCRKNSLLNSSVSIYDPDVTSVKDRTASPEDDLIDDEARRELYGKLSKTLSSFEYLIFTLYLEGMSYSQICEAKGESYKRVDNAIARAKRKLLKSFGN